jgi:phage head maturation protease
LMERGDVSACSFGFTTVDDSWDIVNGHLPHVDNNIEPLLGRH